MIKFDNGNLVKGKIKITSTTRIRGPFSRPSSMCLYLDYYFLCFNIIIYQENGSKKYKLLRKHVITKSKGNTK